MEESVPASKLRDCLSKYYIIKSKFYTMQTQIKTLLYYYYEFIDWPLEKRDRRFIKVLQEYKEEMVFEDYKNIQEIVNYLHENLLRYKNGAFINHRFSLSLEKPLHKEILQKIVKNRLPNFKTLKIQHAYQWENKDIEKILGSSFPIEVKKFYFNESPKIRSFNSFELSLFISPQLLFYIDLFKTVWKRIKDKLAIFDMKIDIKSLCYLLIYARNIKNLTISNCEIYEDEIVKIPATIEYTMKVLSFSGCIFTSNKKENSEQDMFESIIKWISDSKMIFSLNTIVPPKCWNNEVAKELLEKYSMTKTKIVTKDA